MNYGLRRTELTTVGLAVPGPRPVDRSPDTGDRSPDTGGPELRTLSVRGGHVFLMTRVACWCVLGQLHMT